MLSEQVLMKGVMKVQRFISNLMGFSSSKKVKNDRCHTSQKKAKLEREWI